MLISRLPSGGGKGELHGASILVTVEDDGLIGQTVELYFGSELFKDGVISGEKSCLFTNILEIGEYTAKIGELESTAEVTGDNIVKLETVTIDIVSGIKLTEGNTYTFGGYDWTCAEDKGGYYVLQSQGVTGGAWAGYAMSGNLINASGSTINVGNANTNYNGNIDGYDISAYNNIMTTLYNEINFAERSNADYGKGLFLVSNEKAGQTTSEQQGSGNYWSALKTAATNYSSFGASHNGAWFGTAYDSGNAWYVGSGGYLNHNHGQDYSYVVAPAFNLDKSKVRLEGSNDIVAIDAPERLYLYDLGDESVYGVPWETTPLGMTGYTASTLYPMSKTPYLNFYYQAGKNNGYWVVSNKINTAEYARATALVELSSDMTYNYNARIFATVDNKAPGLATTKTNAVLDNTKAGRHILTTDVSLYNEAYVSVGGMDLGNANQKVTILKVWLEK